MENEESYSHSSKRPEMFIDKVTGWNQFSPEVAWFIYDFFRFDLNGYEKLMFYCYFIRGMTLMEIGESADCSFQYIGSVMKKIEKKIGYRWKNREDWEVTLDDSERRNKSAGRRSKERVKSGS